MSKKIEGDIQNAKISDSAKAFLDLFYPVHYKVGIGIEDSMRGGMLTRQQVAILWLIRSEGVGGQRITRKRIETSITRWFELQNSAISKALRAMERDPLELLEIMENPASGRERLVSLTPKGMREIDRMVERGHVFIQSMVDNLSVLEAEQGVHFLARVSNIIEQVNAAEPVKPRRLARKVARKPAVKKTQRP